LYTLQQEYTLNAESFAVLSPSLIMIVGAREIDIKAQGGGDLFGRVESAQIPMADFNASAG